MMRCGMDRVVIRDAFIKGDFVLTGAPLSRIIRRGLGGNWGKWMYCGAVEFVCSPATVSHIPVLLDECANCFEALVMVVSSRI